MAYFLQRLTVCQRYWITLFSFQRTIERRNFPLIYTASGKWRSVTIFLIFYYSDAQNISFQQNRLIPRIKSCIVASVHQFSFPHHIGNKNVNLQYFQKVFKIFLLSPNIRTTKYHLLSCSEKFLNFFLHSISGQQKAICDVFQKNF